MVATMRDPQAGADLPDVSNGQIRVARLDVTDPTTKRCINTPASVSPAAHPEPIKLTAKIDHRNRPITGG